MFFDVDFWWLREVNPMQWHSDVWHAVNDSAVFNPHAFPHTDCGAFGIPKQRYFNSGMFCCNFELAEHRQVFQMARQLRSRVERGSLQKPTDVTDQFYLNYAAHKLSLNVSLLPTKFNFYLKSAQWGQMQFIPRDIYGLHAAGFPIEEKKKALEAQAQVFGYDLCGVHPEVQFWDQARIFEIR
jgi:lipopolysaccharide biosynthesis glycosyltransferase